MKKHQKSAIALTALLILLNSFPVFAAEISEDAVKSPDPMPDNSLMTEVLPVQSEVPDINITDETPIADEATIPNEAPIFSASIQYSWEGYVVKGTFTEFSDDITHIKTLYSTDGETYQECVEEWNLSTLGTKDPDELATLQTQICLYESLEPLKSYMEGKFDRFYLKLRITIKNGSTYESKTAVIERGEVQALPEGTNFNVSFASSVGVIEKNPFNYYGRYQLTVNQAATPEEISAFLPDTLPIQVEIYQGRNAVAECIVDCPVTWKTLSLPQLTAGESVTISDAAEEIVVPEGTLLNTPVGIFHLDETLPLSNNMLSDEVRLILNVIPENENPTGVLSQENDGLEVAFNFKPTGATAIHAYTFSEQESEWIKLSDTPLLDIVNAQPSNANSGYTLIIRNDQEPYQSYLAAEMAGNTPAPFIIGLTIEGGVYDGRQLVLSWPDTYELPPKLPNVGGVGGNESNAGSDNKDDSTDEGQRPNLPKKPKNKQESQPSNSTQTPNDNQDASPTNSAKALDKKNNVSPQNSAQIIKENQNTSPADSAQALNENQNASLTNPAQTLNESQNASPPDSVQTLNEDQNTSPSVISDNVEQQNQGNEVTSDRHKGATQTSAAAVAVTASVTAICIAAITVKMSSKKKKIIKT